MTKSERKLAKVLAACSLEEAPEEKPQPQPRPGKEKKGRPFSYQIMERLSVLSQGRAISKEVNIVKYSDDVPRLDIRCWKRKGGLEQLLRGITLTDEEALLLENALRQYNQRKNPGNDPAGSIGEIPKNT